MRETATFTVSLPPAMARQVERAMKAGHRTRSELVREALRAYLSVDSSQGPASNASESQAYRQAVAAYDRGDYATLGNLLERASLEPANGGQIRGDRKGKTPKQLQAFFAAMAAHSRKVPRLSEGAFTRESFYQDHD